MVYKNEKVQGGTMKDKEKYPNQSSDIYTPRFKGAKITTPKLKASDIEIENNRQIPQQTKHYALGEDMRAIIESIEIGQSFVVSNYKHVQQVQGYGRHLKKKFISRKFFTGTKQSSANRRWRVWYERDYKEGEIKTWEPKNPSSIGKYNPHPSLSKAQVEDTISHGKYGQKPYTPADNDYVLLKNKVIFLENCVAGIYEEIYEIADLMRNEGNFSKTTVGKRWRETHIELEKIRKKIKDNSEEEL